MDNVQFWHLIEDAKKKSGGECEEQAVLLGKMLAKLPPAEIIAFDRILDELCDQLYRWDLWGAGQLINGFCSDDGFFYFRAWLVAQGKTVYENALTNPDSLADVVESDFDNAECEELLYIAGTKYKAKTGKEIPQPCTMQTNSFGDYIVPEPSGSKPNDDTMMDFYPRLWAREQEQNEKG